MPPIATVRRAAAGLGVSALFALAACGNDDQPADPPSQAPQTSAPVQSSSPAASETASSASSTGSSSASSSAGSSASATGNAALLKAGATAEDKGSTGQRLTSIESESGSRWEITLTAADGTETELDVSADGSRVQRGPVRQNDSAADLREQRNERAAAEIDFTQAVKAIGSEQAGRITELNLDSDRGTVVWEANVVDGGTERSVKINAGDGTVISNTADD